MKIVVITNEALKEELLAQGIQDTMQIEWLQEIRPVQEAEGYIDLLFHPAAERIDKLKKLSAAGPGGQPVPVIVNAVSNTLDELSPGFARINGWNSFLKRPLVEVTGAGADKIMVQKIFGCFNKKVEWVPDIAGFITARVISMIINEAWFALDEKVSTKEEIDTAMKLGTNYPFGPFEWGNIIGLKKVHDLLVKLAQTNPRYQPSALLQKEVLA